MPGALNAGHCGLNVPIRDPTRGPDARGASSSRSVQRAALDAYGNALVQLVLFGSRSRSEARLDSDIDVAVVLRELRDRRADRDRLADLAYNAIVETGMDIQ